mgnify:FL=1|jgi:hypothetical protein|tara:strand:- start:453 stop:971 length:519 start_codon:yes stop_codon:yes gene_type:complete
MTKEKTKKQLEKEYAEKIVLYKVVLVIGLILFLGIIGLNLKADQIVHGFKNPSFSGVGTSSHYLTIENQEFNRKENIKAELKAYKEQLKRDAENTTLARFIRNLESRIYAQLSRQLVDALFGDTPQTQGIIELMGNTIEYSVSEDGTMITLKITDPDGNTTEITVPIGSFTF